MTMTAKRCGLVCLLALVALAMLVAGCGGGSSGGSSDESEVEDALTSYLNDFATANGKGVCEALAGPESRSVTESIAEAEPSLQSLSCPEVMTKVSESFEKPVVEALEKVEITAIKIDGETATARFKGYGGEPITLSKVNGDWLVTGGGLVGQTQTIH